MIMLSEGSPASPAMSVPSDFHETGEQLTEARPGSLSCVNCGFAISTAALDALPECPNCGGSRFRRTSIFAQSPSVDVEPAEARTASPEWLGRLRADLEAGLYLAHEGPDGKPVSFRVPSGWTRIGRSGAADIRFDDATVSRRHALIVLTGDRELRALDDRSLNGLFVNGERVEWTPLNDGDELEIGRYRLHVLEV